MAVGGVWIVVMVFVVAIGFTALRFVLSAFQGEWENEGIKMAGAVRKIAKGICLLLFIGAFIFSLYYVFAGLFRGVEGFIYSLAYIIMVFSCVAIMSANIMFLTEFEMTRFELQVKTAINTEKIYKILSGSEKEEIEAEPQQISQQTRGEWLCGRCGMKNNDHSKFCVNCGFQKQ